MTESEAREVLLLRAFESPPAAPWSEADAARCSEDTVRQLGATAEPERLITTRAHLGITRLAAVEPGPPSVHDAIAWTGGWRRLAWIVLIAAVAAGIATDAIGSSQRVNILAPPLIGLLAWNLVVYAALIVSALCTGSRMRAATTHSRMRAANTHSRMQAAPASSRAQVATPAPRGWRQGLWMTLSRMPRLGDANTAAAQAFTRFATAWSREGAALHAARIAALLHAAAALFAIAALASMYLRGLAFEFRAGWESTFLSAQAVRDLLGIVLGPASGVSGIALPDAAGMAALHFDGGNGIGHGENAARWIHLYAITVAGVVLLPRAALALAAALRSRGLSRCFPLALDEAYYTRLIRRHGAEQVAVQVVPYSYNLPGSIKERIQAALGQHLGARVSVHLADVVPLGGEDHLAAILQSLPARHDGPSVAALFALTATPERENHGAFVQALSAALGGPAQLLVIVDESGFRERFTGAQAASRLEQRRDAWTQMLQALGHTPLFVNLADPSGGRA